MSESTPCPRCGSDSTLIERLHENEGECLDCDLEFGITMNTSPTEASKKITLEITVKPIIKSVELAMAIQSLSDSIEDVRIVKVDTDKIKTNK